MSDFGVANSNGGTTSYLPPEVFLAEHLTSLDPKIDIYSLGIVLLEMVLGENPFSTIPAKDIIAAKLNHSFVPVDLPHWLQEIILKSTHPTSINSGVNVKKELAEIHLDEGNYPRSISFLQSHLQ